MSVSLQDSLDVVFSCDSVQLFHRPGADGFSFFGMILHAALGWIHCQVVKVVGFDEGGGEVDVLEGWYFFEY